MDIVCRLASNFAQNTEGPSSMILFHIIYFSSEKEHLKIGEK
jgi:hypothetical protein